MLGKFHSHKTAEQFSNRTYKMSVVMVGDDRKYWVVTLAEMERMLKAGYEVA